MQVSRAHDVTKANGLLEKVEGCSVEQKCAFLNEFWLLYSTTWSKLTFVFFWMLKVHPILIQFYFLREFLAKLSQATATEKWSVLAAHAAFIAVGKLAVDI